ncbi:hypothetical protein GC169_09800 [bacterium]|nr:hypothetical protein [bacterium]
MMTRNSMSLTPATADRRRRSAKPPLAAALLTATLGLAACSPGEAPAASAPAPGAAPAAFRTELSLKELMGHVMEPAADGVWLHQGWEITAEGETEKFPTTDAEWMAAENAATTLAETANLLLLPSRIQEGPEWVDYTNALYDAALQTKAAIEVRDKQAFFDGGGAMYVACRDCHRVYIVGESPVKK